MRIARIVVFCAIALMAGAAFAQDVKTDYDHKPDFSKDFPVRGRLQSN